MEILDSVVPEIREFAARYLDREILPHQAPWYDFIEQNMYSLHLRPREHGKSTTMRTWLLWRLCNNPDLRVLIASHKEEVADEFSRDILMHLERDDLQADFGFSPSKPWRVGQAFLQTSRSLQKRGSTATLGTVAKMSGVTGKRFDIIVCDDPITVETCKSEKMRARFMHWFNAELFPALDHNEHRKVVVFGTRKHLEDWYSVLMRTPHWKSEVQAMYTVRDGVKTYLWPDRFNEQAEAELRAQLTPQEFAMEWMNEPVASDGLRFKRGWIEGLFYRDWRSEVPERFREVHMGIDPSVGSKTDEASYMALAVVVFDKRTDKRDIYVVDMVRAKCSLAEQEDIINAKVKEWEPTAARIESCLVNKIFSERMMRQWPVLQPVVYRAHGASSGLSGTTDISKIGRIENVVGWLFKQGKIHLPDPLIFPMSKMFIESEYLQFPEGSLDLMDALNMACDRIDTRAQLTQIKLWKF
jgi:hypothetical protein